MGFIGGGLVVTGCSVSARGGHVEQLPTDGGLKRLLGVRAALKVGAQVGRLGEGVATLAETAVPTSGVTGLRQATSWVGVFGDGGRCHGVGHCRATVRRLDNKGRNSGGLRATGKRVSNHLLPSSCLLRFPERAEVNQALRLITRTLG